MPEPSGRAAALGLWQGLQEEFARYSRAVAFIPTTELRLQEDLRRYLALRCAGFLEQLTFVVLRDYLERKSGSPVRDFAKSWFGRTPSLTPEAFGRLLGRFGDDHQQGIDKFLDEADRRDA